MMPVPTELPRPSAARRHARDIIDAVVDNMRAGREPLKYSTLAPSRFTVYLHPSEFARLQDILPVLQEETARALSEELERMNRRPPTVLRWLTRLSGQSEPAVRNPAGEWHIAFVPDADGELAEGDLLVDSQLVLPGEPDLGVGERTRRITTVRRGTQAITEGRTSPAPHTLAQPPVARIGYEDENGRHVYEMTQDLISIGRGGTAYPVDLRIESSPDVSREHARIRRDPQSGQFFLIDLSSLGTTLNGRHVPRGYDEVDGRRRENGAETPLPDGARIGLADTVFLDFHLVR
jgi:hypothetical protein